jgi:hypothetical protein
MAGTVRAVRVRAGGKGAQCGVHNLWRAKSQDFVPFCGVRRPATVIVAALALVSACSGGSDTPRALPSLTATATPSATVVDLPTAAKARTAVGADAFVRFFFAQLNTAFSASRPEIITQLSNAECETCMTYRRSLTAARDNGTVIQGDSFVIDDVAAAPLQALGTLVDVTGHVPARKLVTTTGQVKQSLAPDGRFPLTVAVKWIDGRWLVSAVGRSS